MTTDLPAIKRAKIERLNIFEISESELMMLERGSPESLFLNFAIFSASSALSFLVTLSTADISSTRVFLVLVVLCVVGFVAAAVLISLWFWYRKSSGDLFADIRRRMPPEGMPILDAQASIAAKE